jgi:hypothetical protein
MTFPLGQRCLPLATFSIRIRKVIISRSSIISMRCRESDGWFTEHYGGEANGGASIGRRPAQKTVAET